RTWASGSCAERETGPGLAGPGLAVEAGPGPLVGELVRECPLGAGANPFPIVMRARLPARVPGLQSPLQSVAAGPALPTSSRARRLQRLHSAQLRWRARSVPSRRSG